VGQRVLLNWTGTGIAASSYQTFSWGPFTGAYRIVYARFDSATSFQLTRTAGIFLTTDPSTPSALGPFVTPSGWTGLNQAAQGQTPSVTATASLHTPFLTHQNPPAGVYPLDLDIEGSAFYLKVVLDNRIAAVSDFAGVVLLEKIDLVSPTTGIVPRQQPGVIVVPTTPAAAPIGQPRASPTEPATPKTGIAEPTTTTLGPTGSTKPPASTMGPFTLDALDPFESARQTYR